ncbi:PAS domain-containing protein [Ramlibacter sp. RBP-2]|uniref:histidine kinase n=1 Tax=Ramlibacter lithotrophicus TaxID=2606681 RepID=A0A7X6DJ05_9BURK|nr:PAS domain-containing protein [Ramlibacter lithotrophicus]NKE68067.1 PAS domain-containing protein [Ramlibacter lithotrophicus]
MSDRSPAGPREQAALLLAAQRIARMGSWRLDLRSGRLAWSDGTCELFGLDAGQFEGTLEHLRRLVLPEDRPAFERACAARAGEETDYRIRRPDGAVRWLNARGDVECDASGVATARVGVVVDVTERRVARQAHERDAWLLRIASEAARVGGWTIELPERKLTWSDENCLIHDVPPGYQPTLEEGLAYFPPEYREDVIRLVGTCERDGTSYDFEAEKYTAKGRRIWVRCCGEAVRDAAGRIVRLQGSIQDISRQKAAEAQIRSLGVRLTATLENITDGFFTLDRHWRFTYVNAAAERVLERSRDELLGGNIWDKFQPAVGTPFQHHYERALAENATRSFEAFYPQLAKWFEVRVYPSPDGLAVYFRDVTELRRHREALHESERELRALAESMPQMVWMAAPDGSNIYCNQRWIGYTGLGAAESAGAGWLQAVHPDDRQAMELARPRAAPSREDFTVECRLRRADGEYRWMIVRGTPYHDQGGRVVKWMGTCTDVHDLKLSMEAIRISEERFRLLAKGTQDAIWDWDMRADRLWWNTGVETLFGFRPDEGQASIESWSRGVHPDDREATIGGVRQAVAAGADAWSGNYRFRRRDGTYAWVSGRTHVIRGSDGAPVRMIGSIADITERVALEEQLRQAQRLDSLGRLTGGVAHDFNNLLTVIVGNAELLTEQLAAQPRLAALAGMVVQAADRAAELTRHLLAFARKQPLQPRAVDANELVANMAPLLQRTLGTHVEIVLAPADGLWRALVDPAQLDNALLNLCVNARDAMPQGGRLTIATANREVSAQEARLHHGLQAGAYVVLSVSDTGTGIAPEHLRRVFEPFFTTKVPGKGIGLGLAMVYGFAKQSEGHVDISSEPGQGTTVKLFLPRTLDAGVAAPPEADAAPAPGQHETILLVEDDRMVLRYAHEQLVALGYRVVPAETPARALEIIRGREPIDLLFTDMVMPGMNGRQLAEHAARLRPRLKVLYTSGYAEGGVVHGGRVDEGVHLLSKPYRREELARRLREVLARP